MNNEHILAENDAPADGEMSKQVIEQSSDMKDSMKGTTTIDIYDENITLKDMRNIKS